MPKNTPKKPKGLKYGVNIALADSAKEQMAETLKTSDKRVLNSVDSWAFASLFDGRFPGYDFPVLVLKTEEPGSKQLLAFKHDRVESICQDMINHLINDIAVMGAVPLSVQDCIVCGKLEKKTVTRIVKAVADACTAQGCVLTGGETSEQPGVLKPGTYVLTASVVGIAERARVIDGSKIHEGDKVLAVASNGLHTNGYTLVRALLKKKPSLLKKKIAGTTFLDAVLKPHTAYFNALKGLFTHAGLHGMAHITGSGIQGNLERVLPKTLDAAIDLEYVKILPVFSCIREEGRVSDAEMLRTYNMGVGLTIVVAADAAEEIAEHMRAHGHDCYALGTIAKGRGEVNYAGRLSW
jgi:phosphoribosylformylglycinamidine cyclo-ligase